MSEKYNVGVIGATTSMGKAIIELLQQRDFAIADLIAIASDEQEDPVVVFQGKNIDLHQASTVDWSKLNIAFFCDTDETSLKYAPLAADAGVAVIDASNAFSQRPEIPMVIPHINGNAIGDFRNANIIVSPCASAVQLLTVLKPIYDQVGIARVNVTSHHSVSSAGELGIKELARQCAQLLNGLGVEDNPFSAQLAFNNLPQVGNIDEDGLSSSERQVAQQSTKLLGDNSMTINAVSVMTPVFYGLAQSVNIETLSPVEPQDVASWFDQVDELELDPTHQPTQVEDATGTDLVHVGRLRTDPSHPQAINLWSVADNIGTCSALNCLKIAETLVRDFY